MTEKIKKPWGNFETFTKNKKTTVKILTVCPKRKLSLQYHTKRDEYWRILEGACIVIIGDSIKKAQSGDSFFIEKKTKHRIVGGKRTTKILEISFGPFDEEDIIRLEDVYNRV